MSLIIENKKYTLVSEGSHQCTISEIKDLGEITKTFNGETSTKKYVRVVLVVNDQDPDEGDTSVDVRLFMTFSQSLNKKSGLYKFLSGLKIDTTKPVEMADLIDLKVTALVVHNENDGRTYANVVSVKRRATSKAEPVAATTMPEDNDQL
jgi:hypothetical protein